MPRLEDREVRLAVIRDGDEYQEPASPAVAYAILDRAAGGSRLASFGPAKHGRHPWGPLGTPLLDRDDPGRRRRRASSPCWRGRT
jgi:hypothetical protein